MIQSLSADEPRPTASSSDWIEIGCVEEIPLGQGRAFVVGERTIAVFRQRDGRLFASDNRCAHRGGPLAEGILGDGKIVCPLHAWKYDLASGRCAAEAVRVRVYEVAVRGDRVWLNTMPRELGEGVAG